MDIFEALSTLPSPPKKVAAGQLGSYSLAEVSPFATCTRTYDM